MLSEGLAHPLGHGGELAAARALFAGAPEPFIDLSTGINPHSYPLPQLGPDLFARLPDPQALAELAAVAARSYGAPSSSHVVPAPGTQILLPLVAALIDPASATVVGPTYREHARAASLLPDAPLVSPAPRLQRPYAERDRPRQRRTHQVTRGEPRPIAARGEAPHVATLGGPQAAAS